MEKSKIENGGVSLYFYEKNTRVGNDLIRAYTVIDIDVDNDVQFVSIKFDESLANIKKVDLRKCKKVFPQVTAISMNGNVSIPNSMFPNVTAPRFHKTSLLNSFYMDENTVIDMKGCSNIGPHAFDGCKAVDLINTECVKSCAKTSFCNSSFMNQPFKDGVKMAGSILIDIDENADNIIIPSYVTFIAPNATEKFKYNGIKMLTIHSLDTLKILNQNISKKMNLVDTIVLSDKVGITDSFKILHRCKNIKVDNNNRYYKSVAGMLYNKETTELLVCPSGKTGKVEIPDGVIRIRQFSFYESKIEAVRIPGSVCIFEPNAFKDCYFLRELTFCDGLETIKTAHLSDRYFQPYAVSNCKKIETIILPKTLKCIGKFFDNSVTVSNIKIPENIRVIESGAFQKLKGDVKLPDTLQYIGYNNFSDVDSITTKQHIPGLFTCFGDSLAGGIIKINIADNVMFMSKIEVYTIAMWREQIEDELALTGLSDSILKKIDEMSIKSKNHFLVLQNYEQRKNNKLKEYIVRESGHIGMQCVRENNTEMMIKLLNTGLVSEERLKVLLSVSNDKKNAIMSAYLLNAINKINHEDNQDLIL